MTAIRFLDIHDHTAFRGLRLASLEAHPSAFATDDEDWRDAPPEKIEAMLDAGGPTGNLPILGAFSPQLVGMIGLRRETRPSVRHKASLWGMYVDPHHRRAGVATDLVRALLAHARSLPDLEQVRLVVESDNEAAISLFGRLGFEAYGVERRARLVTGTYYDQVYMCAFLEDLPDLAAMQPVSSVEPQESP
jgi:RimJ/RimL family protein N-acetyltransferase